MTEVIAVKQLEKQPAGIQPDPAIVTRLSSRVTLYVPSTGKDQKIISQGDFNDRTEQTAKQLSKLFGGATVTYGSGYWLDNAGRLICERINLVTAQTDPASLAEHYDRILDLAVKLRAYWQQESIALNIDGSLLLID